MSKSVKGETVPESIAEALHSDNGQSEMGVVLLSTGVKLRLKKFPKMVIPDVLKAVDDKHGGRPKVPTVFLKDKGREEENPDDPDYQAAVQAYQMRQAAVINDALIMRGTELLSCPKGVKGMNDPDWLALEQASETPGLDNEYVRYLTWVKHVAALDDEDVRKIIQEVGRLIGISEADVSEAVKSVRR